MSVETLRKEIAACRVCEEALGFTPRPVVQFSPTSRIVIIGQAPGSKVHASGIPWDDDSGERLRSWLGIDTGTFYDADRLALVPMGFCYPGKASGGDKPPRPECAPLWHDRVLATMPKDRLTLLVGTYAQAAYLPETKRWSMAKRIEHWRDFAPDILPLPHPAWRSTLFIRKHPWFEADLLPELQERVRERLE